VRDWDRKRFLKLYTVDSARWLKLSLDAQGVFLLILRKVDFEHGIDLDSDGAECLAAFLGHEDESERIVDAVAALVAKEFIVIENDRLVVPHARKHFGFDTSEFANMRNESRRSYEEVMARSSSVCSYCGGNEKLEIDHKTPLSRGGDNSIENLVAACRACNASKGAKTPEEWERS
jgi:hypothetical protein